MSAIDGLPPLREVIASHGLSARKSLGQNFLNWLLLLFCLQKDHWRGSRHLRQLWGAL